MQYTLLKHRKVYLDDSTESMTVLYMYSTLAKEEQERKQAEKNKGKIFKRPQNVHHRRTK